MLYKYLGNCLCFSVPCTCCMEKPFGILKHSLQGKIKKCVDFGLGKLSWLQERNEESDWVDVIAVKLSLFNFSQS